MPFHINLFEYIYYANTVFCVTWPHSQRFLTKGFTHFTSNTDCIIQLQFKLSSFFSSKLSTTSCTTSGTTSSTTSSTTDCIYSYPFPTCARSRLTAVRRWSRKRREALEITWPAEQFESLLCRLYCYSTSIHPHPPPEIPN